MGVQVEYQAPDTFDMVDMSQLIDAAVASDPDGLVVSIPDADALGDSIRAAVDAGIPVISMNSGSDVAAELGLLNHVGQTEYEAGLGAGQRMGEAGVTNALCVNQEVGNAALDERCRGFTDGLGESGGTVEVLQVDLNNPAERSPASKPRSARTPTSTASSPLARPAPPRPSTRCAAATSSARSARHLRPLARGARGDRSRRHALRHRPAAVPAGLSADRPADPLCDQPEHGRQPGYA